MSYLKFKLNNLCQLSATEEGANPVVAIAPICPDFSGSSLFVRLGLYHGSNLLEQIHEYNVLHALWIDMTGSLEAQQSLPPHSHGGNGEPSGSGCPNLHRLFRFKFIRASRTYWSRFTNMMCYMLYGVTCRDLRRLKSPQVTFQRSYML